MKKQVNIRLSEGLYDDLKRISFDEEKTVTDIIESLVDGYVYKTNRAHRNEIQRISILLRQVLQGKDFESEKEYYSFLGEFVIKTIKRLDSEETLHITMPPNTMIYKMKEMFPYKIIKSKERV